MNSQLFNNTNLFEDLSLSPLNPFKIAEDLPEYKVKYPSFFNKEDINEEESKELARKSRHLNPALKTKGSLFPSSLNKFSLYLEKNKEDLKKLRVFHSDNVIIKKTNIEENERFSKILNVFLSKLPSDKLKSSFKRAFLQMFKKFTEKNLKELEKIIKKSAFPMIIQQKEDNFKNELILKEAIEKEKENAYYLNELLLKEMTPSKESISLMENDINEIKAVYYTVLDDFINKKQEKEDLEMRISFIETQIVEYTKEIDFLKQNLMKQTILRKRFDLLIITMLIIRKMINNLDITIESLLNKIRNQIIHLKGLKVKEDILLKEVDSLENLSKEKRNELNEQEKALIKMENIVYYSKQAYNQIKTKKSIMKNQINGFLDENISLLKENNNNEKIPDISIEEAENNALENELNLLNIEEKALLEEKTCLSNLKERNSQAKYEYSKLLSKKLVFKQYLEKPIDLYKKEKSYFSYILLGFLIIMNIIIQFL